MSPTLPVPVPPTPSTPSTPTAQRTTGTGPPVQSVPDTVNLRRLPAARSSRSTSDGDTEIDGLVSGGSTTAVAVSAPRAPAASIPITLTVSATSAGTPRADTDTPPAGTPPAGTR